MKFEDEFSEVCDMISYDEEDIFFAIAPIKYSKKECFKRLKERYLEKFPGSSVPPITESWVRYGIYGDRRGWGESEYFDKSTKGAKMIYTCGSGI